MWGISKDKMDKVLSKTVAAKNRKFKIGLNLSKGSKLAKNRFKVSKMNRIDIKGKKGRKTKKAKKKQTSSSDSLEKFKKAQKSSLIQQ